jgi:hypothetical protein
MERVPASLSTVMSMQTLDEVDVLKLVDGVHGVGNQLPQENLFFAVEPFFDDGENVLGVDGNMAFFHLGFIRHNSSFLLVKFRMSGAQNVVTAGRVGKTQAPLHGKCRSCETVSAQTPGSFRPHCEIPAVFAHETDFPHYFQ